MIIKWIGSKRKLAEWIVGFMPSHDIYVEPFCGSAAVFSKKSKARVNVLNDINGDLVLMYRYIQRHPEALEVELEKVPYARGWLESPYECYTELERVVRFVGEFNMRMVGAKNGSFLAHSRENPAAGFRNRIGRLREISKFLEDVVIENRDFEEIIKRYDGKRTLFYCDPPYVESENSYGNASVGFSLHRRLAECLKGIKGKFIISYYEHEVLKELYPEDEFSWAVEEVKETSANNVGVDKSVKHVLIMNYKPIRQVTLDALV